MTVAEAGSELLEIEFSETPVALYRLYADDGSLLYVGITNSLKARLGEHAKVKSWWGDVARKTVTWCPTRAEAEQAEAAAIRSGKPAHNIVHADLLFLPPAMHPSPVSEPAAAACLPEFPYEQLAAHLRERIRSGADTPGAKLPPLTYLEEQTGLSTKTIRRSLKILQDEGLVQIVAGRGVFVRAVA